MGELEESVQRHPAGNARKETIWDTAWAVGKAMQVGRDEEQQRIIKLLEDNKHEEGRFIFLDYAISLIKEENK